MGLNHIKGFYGAKKIITRIKRKPRKWKKIFASNSSDKGLIVIIYKGIKN
jgi:hypothetical protein